MAAALCALSTVGLPAAATADVPRSFYGVVAQAHLERTDFERMGTGHVGTLRVALPWAQIDPTPVPEDYDWSEFDATVSEAAKQQITILPTVYTVPQWVSLSEGCNKPPGGPCAITPPHTQVGLAAWRTFLGAAARRYGPGGLFWTLHQDLPRAPIRTWQIWNEQNSPGFYQPRPDVEDYATLLTAASNAIRGQDPSAQIILGGMFRYPLGGRDGGIRAVEFLRSLYARPGLESTFDGVAVHPYAGRVSGVRRQVQRVKQVVDEAGDEGVQLWVTEVGWASGGKATPLNRGLDGQARRLTQAFRYFTEERERLNLKAVLWYAWRDVDEQDSRCKWCAQSGLFPVGSLADPKPAWSSFIQFTGGG